MVTKSYKDLIVWQRAIELVMVVYELTKLLPPNEQFGISSQIKRAAVSIPSNIAEGYKRNNRKEYIQFCGIACGSAAEVETQLIIIARLFPDIDTSIAEGLSVELQKMLTVLITRLRS